MGPSVVGGKKKANGVYLGRGVRERRWLTDLKTHTCGEDLDRRALRSGGAEAGKGGDVR